MAEEQQEEPPEPNNSKNNNAAPVLAPSPSVPIPVPWTAAVAARYDRREKLGEGMFGDVYKAWDRAHDRFVAVKRLSGRTDDRFIQTLLPNLAREAMSLGSCRGHPSIIELVSTHADSARADGDCFVVTEYAGPMNLRKYINVRRIDGPAFSEAEVRDAVRQLLAGAEHAHAAGVLHRDITPENVVVDVGTDGRRRMVYKICGFGMSEPADQAWREEDGSGMLACSSPYRAPELFLGCKDYDGRVDTWSIGCIMAELVDSCFGGGAPFFGAALDREVFDKMMEVVGARGIVEWPGLELLAPSETVERLREETTGGLQHHGCLKEWFPRKALSPAGFKVLEGLLCSNPDRRLSAADALGMSWFVRRHSFGGCLLPRAAA